jgi:molybdopterin-guanine dinucleotide biosynthesis protein A
MASYKHNSNVKEYSLALLCGGRSLRLGADKGLYRPTGDESLARRALRLFSPHFKSVMLIVGDQEQLERYKEEINPDSWPNVSILTDMIEDPDGERCALNGVFTALSLCKTSRVVILPVDQVGVSMSHVLRLTETTMDTLSGCFETYSGIEPFPAVMSKLQTESVNAALKARQFLPATSKVL